jgi:hypothetical protein
MNSIAYRVGDIVCRALAMSSCADGGIVHALGYDVIVIGLLLALLAFFHDSSA